MKPSAARITLMHEGERVDLAIRAGTSLGSALAARGLDLEQQRRKITTAMGLPVSTSAIMGRDLIDGEILLTAPLFPLNRSPLSEGPRPEAVLRSSIGNASALLIAGLAFTLGCLPPLLGHHQHVPLITRGAFALLLGIMVLTIATRHPDKNSDLRRALGTATLPLVGGVAAALLLPDTAHDLGLQTLLMASWGTAVAALVFWIIRKGACEAIAACIWSLVAVTVTAVPSLKLPWEPLLPVLMAVGAMGGLVVPAWAARVPDSQLIDLTPIRSLGRSVREPDAPAPRTISRSGAARYVDQATASSISLEVACAAVVLAALPTTVRLAAEHGLPAWGARAELVSVIALLLLRPRATHCRTLRTIPRLAVAAMALLALVSIWRLQHDPWSAIWTPAAPLLIFIIATGLLILGLAQNRSESAWWGRLGDIFQSIAALCALPSAVIAAGMIDIMRQL